jgi:hypothetical protein
MVARTNPAEASLRLTQENHPENAPHADVEEQPTSSLLSAIGIGALCSLIGMAIGSAALSTAFLSDNRWEAITLLPMVGTAVCILGGWVGAFVHMIRSDSSSKQDR